MNNKLLKTTLASCALLVSVGVMAEPPHPYHNKYKTDRYSDYARVTFVEPVYRTVRVNEPRQECWDEERTYQSRRESGDKTAGGIIGGILGGVAGHQVGKGHGKTAATIAGVMLGSKIGRDLNDGGDRIEQHRDVETVCRTVDNITEEERLDGYRVGYRYQGREYRTFMKRHPGERVRVRVKVTLDE